MVVPDTSLHDMQAAQESQLDPDQEDLLLTYSMWDPQVVLRKCKRKRRLAARRKREEDMPSSSEHSSDEEYVRPVYVRTRINRPSLARIEAEKERLYSELERCKKKLALAKKKCAARKKAGAIAGPSVEKPVAASTSSSVVIGPCMPHGNPVIPSMNTSRPVITVYNTGKPSLTNLNRFPGVSTPKLTVKGPKRTYASKRAMQVPQHPVCEKGWLTPTSAEPSTSTSEYIQSQVELFQRQRSLTINSNLPESRPNLPRFFSNQVPGNINYIQNPPMQVPYPNTNAQQVLFKQFDPRSLNCASSSLNSMVIMPTYQIPYGQGIQPVLQQQQPRVWANFIQNNGHIATLQNQVALTPAVSAPQFLAQQIRLDLPQNMYSSAGEPGKASSHPSNMLGNIPNYTEVSPSIRGNIPAPRYVQLSVPRQHAQMPVFPPFVHRGQILQASSSQNFLPRFTSGTDRPAVPLSNQGHLSSATIPPTGPSEAISVESSSSDANLLVNTRTNP